MASGRRRLLCEDDGSYGDGGGDVERTEGGVPRARATDGGGDIRIGCEGGGHSGDSCRVAAAAASQDVSGTEHPAHVLQAAAVALSATVGSTTVA
jgi:hypothetical protein